MRCESLDCEVPGSLVDTRSLTLVQREGGTFTVLCANCNIIAKIKSGMDEDEAREAMELEWEQYQQQWLSRQ